MNFHRTILMALKSIFNNKVRSILTMLGIIIGIAAVMTIVSIIQGLKAQVMESYSSFGVNNVDMYMETQDKTKIDDILTYAQEDLSDLIVAITPSYSMNSTIRYRIKSAETNVNFGSETFDLCSDRQIAAGRAISKMDIRNRAKVCVIGERIRKNFFGAMSPIGQKIKINGQNYKVVGAYTAKSDGSQYSTDDMVLLPSSLMWEVTGHRMTNEYKVKAKDTDSTLQFVEKINEYASDKFNSDWEYFSAYSNTQWQEQEAGMADLISLVGGAIAGISLLVGGIGIMNIMLVSVTERTREIGIRMAIGAGRKDIILQFLVEASAISATGGVIGIGLGYILTTVGGTYVMGLLSKSPRLVLPPVGLTIGAFLFSVFIGIIFGIYPANKASKLQPVDALRSQ